MSRSELVRRSVLVGVLIALVAGTLGSVAGVSAAGSAAPSALHTALSKPAVTHLPPLAPHPLVLCPMGYPGYQMVGNVFPVTPNQYAQTPCPPINQDEVHATFSSGKPYSAERWTIPLRLPGSGSPGQVYSYSAVHVGMVVSGDRASQWHQSYLEVAFSPSSAGVNATVTYQEHLAVLSMVNATYFSSALTCPSYSMNFSWNNSYFCEFNDLGSGSGVNAPFSLPANSSLNVTFAGVKGSSAGMTVWVNDSALTGHNETFHFNATNTGSYSFEPYYNASCPDQCFLNWSFPFGLGVGFDICPEQGLEFAGCNSYNQTYWSGNPPVEMGAPEYYNVSSYSGDYYYLAPQSSSGVCNVNPPNGVLVATCQFYIGMGGSGYYPYFTFNGTKLAFGNGVPWAKWDFGGASQYSSSGTQIDLKPFEIYSVKNDSSGGYVHSAHPFNVTTELLDLGSVSSATLTYRIGSGGPTALPMTRVAGSLSDGFWRATIPGTGGDATINYSVSARNAAGVPVTSPTDSVVRGPFPHFGVTLDVSPARCLKVVGGVPEVVNATTIFNGSSWTNGSVVSVLPGVYPIQSESCYPYVWSAWSVSRGLLINQSTPTFGNLTVTYGGTVTGTWTYKTAHDVVTFAVVPSVCGAAITFNGSTFSNAQSTPVLDATNVLISAGACGSQSFAGWTFVGNFTILGSIFTAHGNGTLTANYIPFSSASSLLFHTLPASCGGVLYRGAGYVDGESIAVNTTSYPIAPDPCRHFGFIQWTTSGGASVGGGQLTVTSAGSVTEVNQVQTWVTVQTFPAGCGSVTFDGSPYTNGTVLVVQNNSTHSAVAVPCTGYHLIAVTGTGGVLVVGNVVTVNGSGDLNAVFAFGPNTVFVDFITEPSGCGQIVFAGTPYSDSNFTYVSPNTVATISSLPCSNYGFVTWITVGPITVVGNTVYVNQSGAIEAVFQPLVALFLYASPTTCGTLLFNGQVYPDNTTLYLPDNNVYTIGATGCAQHKFNGWLNTSNAQILGNQLILLGPAQLTAQFILDTYSVQVFIDPANCGSLVIHGTQATNNTTVLLNPGNYTMTPIACVGDSLVSTTTSGNVSAVGTKLTVTGNGSLTATLRPVPPAVVFTAPASTLAGAPVEFLAVVQVLVPPYNYNYTWTFGDGGAVSTPANFTYHSYASPGTYHASVLVTDPYNRTARENATVVVTSGSSTSGFGVPATTYAILGVVAVVVAAILLFSRRPKGPAPGEETASTETVPPEEGLAEVEEPLAGPPADPQP